MSPETPDGDGNRAPRDVGRVPVEIVGIDDVRSGEPPSEPPRSQSSRTMAAAGYLAFPVAVYAYLTPRWAAEPFVEAHALQSIALWALTAIIFVVPCIGTVLAVLPIAVAVFAAVRAWNGEYVQIPIVWPIVRRYM